MLMKYSVNLIFNRDICHASKTMEVMMNREEILKMICESSVYDLCTMIEENKIIEELENCMEGTDYE